MTDLRPLFDDIHRVMGPETEEDFERVSRITQLDPEQLAARPFVGPRHTLKQEVGGGVAVGVNGLKGGFPDVTVAGLRVGFVGAFRIGGPPANWLLVKPPVLANLEAQAETSCADTERFGKGGYRLEKRKYQKNHLRQRRHGGDNSD